MFESIFIAICLIIYIGIWWMIWEWLWKYFITPEPEQKLEPITNFKWSYDMKAAKIKLTWLKSVSPDVVEQILTITGDEVRQPEISLPTSVEDYIFTADEKVVIHAELYSVDASGQESDVDSLDFVVPDLEKPATPSFVGWDIVEVVDLDLDPIEGDPQDDDYVDEPDDLDEVIDPATDDDLDDDLDEVVE